MQFVKNKKIKKNKPWTRIKEKKEWERGYWTGSRKKGIRSNIRSEITAFKASPLCAQFSTSLSRSHFPPSLCLDADWQSRMYPSCDDEKVTICRSARAAFKERYISNPMKESCPIMRFPLERRLSRASFPPRTFTLHTDPSLSTFIYFFPNSASVFDRLSANIFAMFFPFHAATCSFFANSFPNVESKDAALRFRRRFFSFRDIFDDSG